MALRPLIVTSGVFDLLRRGHKECLKAAKALAPHGTLLVFLDCDKSVRLNRGEGKPITNEHERARRLLALPYVDCVYICRELHPDEEMLEMRPDYYVKGGDCSLETMDPKFREALQAIGCQISFIPREHNFSTTRIIERLKKWGKLP